MIPGTDWAEQARHMVEALRGVLGAPAADGDHPADAAAECRWCPVCQFIAVLRGERPEATAVIADVLRATADALHAFAAAPDGPRAGASEGADAPVGDPPPVVQRIEIA